MTTARQIITSAMRKVGALIVGQSPSAEEANDALTTLNNMLSMWSNESLNIIARKWESFPLTGNVDTYTIGSGQNFNTVRPIYLVESYVRIDTIDYNLSIIPDEVYNGSIWNKSQQGIPEFINYDNGYPYGKLRLYPVPSAAWSLFLLSEKELPQFTLDDDILLPPGWEMALIYNLAILIAPEYGQPVTPELAEIAKMSKASIETAIAKTRSMDASPGIGARGNIYNGWYQ